jgi:RNA-splicing ligase RtcB
MKESYDRHLNVFWNYNSDRKYPELESMKDVYTTSVVSETLDEAPQAYKSIDEIKSAITDTVDIIGIIKPLYNFKSH